MNVNMFSNHTVTIMQIISMQQLDAVVQWLDAWQNPNTSDLQFIFNELEFHNEFEYVTI